MGSPCPREEVPTELEKRPKSCGSLRATGRSACRGRRPPRASAKRVRLGGLMGFFASAAAKRTGEVKTVWREKGRSH